jgi:hypothetical protein
MAATAGFFGFDVFDGLDVVFFVGVAAVRFEMAGGRLDVFFVHLDLKQQVECSIQV